MRSRTIAIAGSIAALAFAATPVAAVAATTHHSGTKAASVDRSRDLRDARHIDRSPDRTKADHSADRSADRSVG
jgi:Ni/Co efflux regulator RcnB